MRLQSNGAPRAAAWVIVALGLLHAGQSAANDLRVAIWVVKLDGSGLRKVVQVEDYKEHSSPRWSHDGKRLAFDTMRQGTGAKRVFIVNVDGTGLQEIGETAAPDWSPDDKQIALRLDGPEGGIMVQNLDGKGRTAIAAGDGPRWSPDGSKLAFTNRYSVKVLDLVSGEEHDRLDVPVQEVFSGCDWSPDGKRLAVVARRGKERELLLVRVEGPTDVQSRLTRNLDGRVTWSPDGKHIVISSGRLLYILEPDGKGLRLLPGQRGESVEPAWSPDGNWLAFSGNPQPPAAAAPATEAKK
jgi:Tol biopolymer transport system component